MRIIEKNISLLTRILIILMVAAPFIGTAQISINKKYKSTVANTMGSELIVSTGKVERRWQITSHGLTTSGLKNTETKREWTVTGKNTRCDWSYEGLVTDTSTCKLIGLTANQGNDDGFTSDYLEVVAEFEYPFSHTFIKYHIWAYPDAPGLRTQVWIKGKASESMLQNEPDEATLSISGRCDFLPVDASDLKRLYAGYYNDTQHRNNPETPLVKEEEKSGSVTKPENINWASILMVSGQNEGLALVKESHKCVNQFGVETGDFQVSSNGIENRGTSLFPKDLSPDEYKWYWSSWTILYSGNDDDGRAAIKAYDRIRYPIIPELDIYTMANTWGSSRNREASREQNVLKEIDSQANLGIDIQQIDDGWQDKSWLPSKEWYPTGWGNVVERAKEKKIKLGLWGAAMPITPEALRYNYENGGFVTYKLDFANLSTHDKIDKTIGKIRSFIQWTNHKVRVNWDVTENAPRYGYFWAREYGSVFLENRKPDVPVNVVYVPHLVLRDLWHLSKYANLNKFQGSVQNVAMIDKKLSDAWEHSQAYATAIPLMSTPLFFQETQFLSPEAVAQIKPILAAYKTFRNELYECFVYPIGNEPNNETWAGFQAVHPEKKLGYLTLFREINNKETSKTVQLLFLGQKQLKITDLMTGKTFRINTNKEGKATFEIPKSGDFRMYKYEY
jgi:hypothetical protein